MGVANVPDGVLRPAENEPKSTVRLADLQEAKLMLSAPRFATSFPVEKTTRSTLGS